MKVKPKAPVFDAIQFKGPENYHEVLAFMGRTDAGLGHPETNVLIGTLEGEIAVGPGDWVVKKSDDIHCRVLSPEAFSRAFEPAGFPPRPPAKHPFDYHAPSPRQIEQISEVRAGCKDLHAILLKMPTSPEMTLAIRKLEECSMWANKGIILVDEGPVKV